MAYKDVPKQNPRNMTQGNELLKSIKKNSPAVYEILKQQSSKKWEITNGCKFETTDKTTTKSQVRSAQS